MDQQGYLGVGTELLNLGVGALSLIVMLALIRLVQVVVSSTTVRTAAGVETERLQAQTNLKIVEHQSQMAVMFEKLEAGLAFNAGATQKQTVALDQLVADGKIQISSLADIKNSFISTKSDIANAVTGAQQPIVDRIDKDHDEILLETRASQKLLTAVADRVDKLPTTADMQDAIRREVSTLLNQLSTIQTELLGVRSQAVTILDKVTQLQAGADHRIPISPAIVAPQSSQAQP